MSDVPNPSLAIPGPDAAFPEGKDLLIKCDWESSRPRLRGWEAKAEIPKVEESQVVHSPQGTAQNQEGPSPNFPGSSPQETVELSVLAA